MNILVISVHGMYTDYSASFIHNQAKEYVRQGHRVRVLIPLAFAKKSNEGRRIGPYVEMFERDHVEICYMRCLSLSNFGETHQLNVPLAGIAIKILQKELFRDFRPDVIHAHTILYGGGIGVKVKALFGCPLIVTTHGGDADVALSHMKETRKICKEADAIVAVSEKLRTVFDNALCITNGFCADNIPPDQRKRSAMIQVGHLIALKHVDNTIQAFAHLKKLYPEFTLTVVGEGTERENLESLARRLKVWDSVRFTGQLSNPDTLEEMAKARFFIMPSYPEGFGIVYLEAMACGCITVGTEKEGIADVIVSGENGFLVPRDDVDAIIRIVDWCLQNPEKADEIAARGRETAMQHTWSHNAQEYLELFQTLMDRKGV